MGVVQRLYFLFPIGSDGPNLKLYETLLYVQNYKRGVCAKF